MIANKTINNVLNQQDTKIVIVDYISEKNRGDAAIHLGLINILRRCYPNATVSAVSVIGANQFPEMEQEYDQSRLLGIKVVGGLVPTFYPEAKKRKNPTLIFEIQNMISMFFRLWLLIALKLKVPIHFLERFLSKKYQITLEHIKNADLIVIRGRNYRDRKTAALEIVRMLSKIYHLILCSLLSKKMVLVGASVWDQKSNLAGRMLGFAFKSCKFVTVRETCSFDAARKIANTYNFPEPVLIPDLSFAVFKDRKGFIQNREGFSRSDHPEVIGLTLHDWKAESWETRNKYFESIAGLVRYYSNLDSRIIIIPQVSVPWEDNSNILHQLLAAVNAKSIKIIAGEPSIQELLQLYSDLDLLVATRMHSAIFAAAVNTPIVAIPYDKGGKWSIIEELGYKEYLLNYDQISPELLIKKIYDCWHDKKSLVTFAERVVEKNIVNLQLLADLIMSLDNNN